MRKFLYLQLFLILGLLTISCGPSKPIGEKMVFTFQIDIFKSIKELAHKDRIDRVFTDAIFQAKMSSQGESIENVYDSFVMHFDSLNQDDARELSYYFPQEFNKQAFVDHIESGTIQILEVINKRLNDYDLEVESIDKDNNYCYNIHLFGVDSTNESQVFKMIYLPGRLNIHVVKSDEKLCQSFKEIDKFLAIENGVINVDINSPEISGELSDEEILETSFSRHPFTTLFETVNISTNEFVGNYDMASFPKGDYQIFIEEDNIPKFKAILSRPEVKELFSERIDFIRGLKPLNKPSSLSKEYEMHAVEIEGAFKNGPFFEDVRTSEYPDTKKPLVLLEMNEQNAKEFEKITKENMIKRLAIIIDNAVYSAPIVQSTISGGICQVPSFDDDDEARSFQILLKSGPLKLPVTVVGVYSEEGWNAQRNWKNN